MFIFFAGVKASISIQSMELALNVSRVLWILVLIWSVGFPVVYLSIIIKERVWVLVASFLFLIFAGCLLFTPLLMQAKTLMPPPIVTIVTVDDGDERTLSSRRISSDRATGGNRCETTQVLRTSNRDAYTTVISNPLDVCGIA
jgi:hypothetical protein